MKTNKSIIEKLKKIELVREDRQKSVLFKTARITGWARIDAGVAATGGGSTAIRGDSQIQFDTLSSQNINFSVWKRSWSRLFMCICNSCGVLVRHVLLGSSYLTDIYCVLYLVKPAWLPSITGGKPSLYTWESGNSRWPSVVRKAWHGQATWNAAKANGVPNTYLDFKSCRYL